MRGKYAEFLSAIHSSQGVRAIRAWRCVNNLRKLFVGWGPSRRHAACISAAILSNCTSLAARLHIIILINHSHTSHSVFSVTYTPSLQTHLLALYYHLHAPQYGPHKPERLDGWLWRAAIITSVYLISVLLSEPLSVPLSPLLFSPRTRSLTPLGRSALLGKPLWTQQKDTTKTESRTAHVRTDNRHTCVEACQSSQRIWDVLAEQTRACLGFEVAVSISERLKDIFFL